MNRAEAITWALSVCTGFLRPRQAKPLSQLVASALHVGRVSLGQIGRLPAGRSNTHSRSRIKRVERFVANERIEIGTAIRPVVRRLLKR